MNDMEKEIYSDATLGVYPEIDDNNEPYSITVLVKRGSRHHRAMFNHRTNEWHSINGTIITPYVKEWKPIPRLAKKKNQSDMFKYLIGTYHNSVDNKIFGRIKFGKWYKHFNHWLSFIEPNKVLEVKFADKLGRKFTGILIAFRTPRGGNFDKDMEAMVRIKNTLPIMGDHTSETTKTFPMSIDQLDFPNGDKLEIPDKPEPIKTPRERFEEL